MKGLTAENQQYINDNDEQFADANTFVEAYDGSSHHTHQSASVCMEAPLLRPLAVALIQNIYYRPNI